MDVRGMVELIKKDIGKTNSYDRYPIRFSVCITKRG